MAEPFEFVELPMTVPQAKDCIYGRYHDPVTNAHILGNYAFWIFVRTCMLTSAANGAHWLEKVLECAQLFSVETGCLFYLALSATRVCLLPLGCPLLQSFVRQTFSDVYRQLTRGELPDQDQVINHVEARCLWFATFQKGTVQNLLWRLWEEAPTRDDILSIIPLFNPSNAELAEMANANRNVYNMTSRILTIRYYKTNGTHGVKNYKLSDELCIELNAYITAQGFFNANFPTLNGVRQLFGYKDNQNVDLGVINNATVDEWFQAAGLTQFFPFTVNGAEDKFSALRKVFTSFCDDDERVSGQHIQYKDEDSNFPSYDELMGLQLHGKYSADTYYNYYVRYVLKY
jgi:hypothetical protein